MAANSHDDLPRLDRLTRSQVEAYQASYGAALSAKARTAKGGEALPELDAWYQALPALPPSSSSSASSSALLHGGQIAGKPELVKLMQWKLSREKHRPTLLSLISSNPPSLCSSTLTRAADHLSSCIHSQHLSLHSPPADLLAVVEATMKILCELRGVGPATSSAIVASWTDFGVFQSDELAIAVLGGAKVEYTMPFYRRFYAGAIEMLKRLASNDVGIDTGREMEKVAWSIAHSPHDPPRAVAEQGKVEEKIEGEVKVEGRAKVAKRKTPEAAAARDGHEENTNGGAGGKGRRTSKRIRAKPAC